MKNRYEVNGDVTTIFIDRRDGTTREILVDTEDLPKLLSVNYIWKLNLEKSGKVRNVSYTKCLPTKKDVYLHRFLLDYVGPLVVDHANCDPTDNRKANLRLATRTQNAQNRKGPTCVGTSGYRNVYYSKRDKNWRVALAINKKKTHIGVFSDKEEANLAAIAARARYIPFNVEAV